ncbi:YaaA family protein [Salisaeta longa]|uniref:YaaA family protein n=1 Tax=Salisaeta longa TaxID=503170 RepID=UPI0003B2ED43|nr:peroxide stress protein YaaA [Salisaeta longa]
MPKLSVLLAPSETKQPGGNPFAPDMFDYRTSGTFNYFDSLNPERRKLIDAIHAVIETGDEAALADLFQAEGPILDEAVQAMAEIYDAPLMSALDRFSPGIMYAAMDFANLPTGAQRRLLENGIIFSGLFGLLRPDDLIPNYQLGMEATVPTIGPVTDYWRPLISDVLNDYLRDRFVWDLLPEVHRSVWVDEHTYEARVRVRFEEVIDGERQPVPPEEAAIQKGQFVNYIVQETAEELDDLLEWEHPDDFVFDEAGASFDDETNTWSIAMVQE